MYLGYVRGGVLGATAVGIAFVAPSFFMVVAISVLYVRYDGLKWMQALFYGIGAAVIGIILRSTIKLGRATLKKTLCYGQSSSFWRFLPLVPAVKSSGSFSWRV